MHILMISTVAFLCLFVLVAIGAWASGLRTKKGRRFTAIYALLTALAFGTIVYLSFTFDEMRQIHYYQEILYGGLLAHSWLIAVVFAAPILLGLGIFRWLRTRKEVPAREEGISRRDFFTYCAAAVPTTIFLGNALHILSDGTATNCRKLDLHLPNLPTVLENHKIGHISDMHLGPYSTLNQLRSIFAHFADQRVDRVCITGDLIDNINLLDGLKALLIQWEPFFPQGIQYILGNHEYYRDKEKILATLEETPITILRNSHIPLDEKGESYLAGVDFPFQRSNLEEEMKGFLDEAMDGIPEKTFTILLAHHPDFIGHAFARNIPLTLAGHSHGGQINLGNHSVVPLKYTYWRGLYEQNGNFGYVSTGAGDWFPVRMDCPREYTIITLHRGHSDNNLHNQYS